MTDTQHPVIHCRDCRHWLWPGIFDLNDYPRDRPVKGGWADGVCQELLAHLTIECTGGWNGCTVDSVETDANFWCAFGEAKQSEESQ
jgi:hypothetical protein